MVMTTIVAAVALGILAQVMAERLKLPAILPLLVLGMAFGPHAVGLFDPESLGGVLEVFIHLGVAIILFEGGLTLDFSRLVRERGPVRNLLTIGVVVTGAGAAWAAHVLAGMSWSTAALFGAIMTVTGPTVIVPLLRHMIVPRRIKTILVSEGLIIDPVGAVLAYLVLQWIQRSGVAVSEMAGEVVLLTLAGTILGFAGGALAKFFLRNRFVSGELRNLVVLAILMVTYLGAERQASQSGILAAVVMGITVAADELPDLVSLRAFKGQVTALVISVLFILLAGELDLGSIWALGAGGWGVVAVLILLVRPLAVVLSVWPSMADGRDRLVLAMTAPRGIVAAAIASLAARDLAARGLGGAHALEGLVYLSILVTGAWATAGAVILPRVLGYLSDPSRRRTVLVGENALTTLLGKVLQRLDWTVVVVDAVSWRLERARAAGFETVLGDARDAITHEEAGVEADTLVVAATTNDELNLLVAELVHHEFDVPHPVAVLQRPPEELGRRSRAWLDVLGGRAIDVPRWLRMIEANQVEVMELDLGREGTSRLLLQTERQHPEDLLRLVAVSGGRPNFSVSGEPRGEWERLIVLVARGRVEEMLAPALATAGPAGEAESSVDEAGEVGATARG